MRDLFPGYFPPSDDEFKTLWSQATFAFDANVLLGLYRLTSETRQLFFDLLRKFEDRIFLPHQSADEYLHNRLDAISARYAFFETVKKGAQKFAQSLDAGLKDHSIQRGQEILDVANRASHEISEIVDAAVQTEDNFRLSDEVQSTLAAIFDKKTGQPFDQARYDEICRMAAARYERRVPPGFKDNAKSEPDRYGDVLIWYQLMDHAALASRPIVFITRDAKEDWWLRHNGETIGPRPELVQEMKAHAGVRFYMYTMQKFIEYAQGFFNLGAEPARKAATEIEKVNEQLRQANETPGNSSAMFSLKWSPVTMEDYTYLTNLASTSIPQTAGYCVVDTRASKEAEARQETDFALLPINGQVFSTRTGKWRCEVVNSLFSSSAGRVGYGLKFEHQLRGERSLTLWLSTEALEADPDWRYKHAIFRIISQWLEGGKVSEEITYLP